MNKHIKLIITLMIVLIFLVSCSNTNNTQETIDNTTETPDNTTTNVVEYKDNKKLSIETIEKGIFIERLNNKSNYKYEEFNQIEHVIKQDIGYVGYKEYESINPISKDTITEVGYNVRIVAKSNLENITELTVEYIADSAGEEEKSDIELILAEAYGEDFSKQVLDYINTGAYGEYQIVTDFGIVNTNIVYQSNQQLSTVYQPAVDEEERRFEQMYKLIESGMDSEQAKEEADKLEFGEYIQLDRYIGTIVIQTKLMDLVETTEIDRVIAPEVVASLESIFKKSNENLLDTTVYEPFTKLAEWENVNILSIDSNSKDKTVVIRLNSDKDDEIAILEINNDKLNCTLNTRAFENLGDIQVYIGNIFNRLYNEDVSTYIKDLGENQDGVTIYVEEKGFKAASLVRDEKYRINVSFAITIDSEDGTIS